MDDSPSSTNGEMTCTHLGTASSMRISALCASLHQNLILNQKYRAKQGVVEYRSGLLSSLLPRFLLEMSFNMRCCIIQVWHVTDSTTQELSFS